MRDPYKISQAPEISPAWMDLDLLTRTETEHAQLRARLRIPRDSSLEPLLSRVRPARRRILERLTFLENHILTPHHQAYPQKCEVDIIDAVRQVHEDLGPKRPRYRFCPEVIVDHRDKITELVIGSHRYHKAHLSPTEVHATIERLDSYYREIAAQPVQIGPKGAWIKTPENQTEVRLLNSSENNAWIIQKIRVEADIQGLGVATHLIDALIEEWPDRRWGSTWLRDDGMALFAHLRKKYPDKGF